MSEFNNRIDLQRELLSVVNSYEWTEELFGLSSGAIKRWAAANGIDSSTRLFVQVRKAGELLFFLANKSQEQVTDEYKSHSSGIDELKRSIAVMLKEIGQKGERHRAKSESPSLKTRSGGNA